MVDVAVGRGVGLAPKDPYWAAIKPYAPAIRRVLIGLFLIAAFTLTSAVLLFVITAEQLQGFVNAPQFASLKVSAGWIRQDVATVQHYWTLMNGITRMEDQTQDALYRVSLRNQTSRSAMTRAAEETRNFINTRDTAYILPPLKLKSFTTNLTSAEDTAPAPDAPQPIDSRPNLAPPEAASPEATASGSPRGSLSTAAETKASSFDLALAQPVSLRFGDDVDAYFDNYYSQLGTGDEAARKSLTDFKAETFKHLEGYFAARAQYQSDASAIRALKGEIDTLEHRADRLNKEVQAPGTPLADGAYWSLTEDFLSFKTLFGDWAYNIVGLPRMMLVLALSIFMGILGSLIYISQDFLRNPDSRGFWDILFRIGLGAGVAFALFFFAAAGMLAMAQDGGGKTDMSPYLISFLGITGGYLSDRVTQWMREVGESAFRVKTDGPPARWAVGLADMLKNAGLDAAALAAAANVLTEDAEAWVSLAKSVPGDKQGLVAAFVREHPSKVFTDIQPAPNAP